MNATSTTTRVPTAEAAQYIGIGESTLRAHRRAGTGPVSYSIGRRIYYDVADLDNWITAQKAASQRSWTTMLGSITYVADGDGDGEMKPMGDCTVEDLDHLIDLEKTAIIEREIVIIQLEQLRNLIAEQAVTKLSEVVR